MKRSLENSDSQRSIFYLSETAIEIAKLYFEDRIIPFSEKLIKAYDTHEDGAEIGKKCLLKELYRCVNYSHENFQKYLNYKYLSNSAVNESHSDTTKFFISLSKYSNGVFSDNQKVFLQIARVSISSQEDSGALKVAIGNYFKTNFISYLKENYRELYEKCEIEEASKTLIGFSSNLHSEAPSSAQELSSLTVTQDLVPPSSMAASSYSSLRGLNEQEQDNEGFEL